LAERREFGGESAWKHSTPVRLVHERL
jgi:hypothetical protein